MMNTTDTMTPEQQNAYNEYMELAAKWQKDTDFALPDEKVREMAYAHAVTYENERKEQARSHAESPEEAKKRFQYFLETGKVFTPETIDLLPGFISQSTFDFPIPTPMGPGNIRVVYSHSKSEETGLFIHSSSSFMPVSAIVAAGQGGNELKKQLASTLTKITLHQTKEFGLVGYTPKQIRLSDRGILHIFWFLDPVQ